jgi:hypothetical protein
VAQFRHLALWLRPAAPAREFHFQLPQSARTEFTGGVWFVQFDKTWLALRPIGLGEPKEKPWQTLAEPAKGNDKEARLPRAAETERVFVAAGPGADYVGFALEVGESARGSFVDFQRAALSKSRLDLGRLREGSVFFTGSDGATLKLTHNGKHELPAIERNGAPVDWAKWRFCYSRGSVGEPPVQQDWLSGELRVHAGGWHFTSRVGVDGRAGFAESRE